MTIWPEETNNRIRSPLASPDPSRSRRAKRQRSPSCEAIRNKKRQHTFANINTPRVFSWDVKGRLVPKSVEGILSNFERRLEAIENNLAQRVEGLEGRVKVLELLFEDFKEMDIMWAQEIEETLSRFRSEIDEVRRGEISGASDLEIVSGDLDLETGVDAYEYSSQMS